MAASDYRESCCGRYVMLGNGLALPLAPILLALELERRGVKLWRDGEDIVIEPFTLLSDEGASPCVRSGRFGNVCGVWF